MWTRRHTILLAFLGMLATTFLFGCRAFQPEVVIVNKFPETFIMVAPAETSGGRFHFHVRWYGIDADGYVDRYVWALTDTSIQDVNTGDDDWPPVLLDTNRHLIVDGLCSPFDRLNYYIGTEPREIE